MKDLPIFTHRLYRILLVAAVMFLFSGCGRTAEVSYYQLTVSDNVDDTIPGDFTKAVVGVGPVRLPQYLDRPQMLVRLGSSQVGLSENHRWVEPLQENIPRILRENLSAALGSERIVLYPWDRNISVTYQLVVDFVRFEGEGLRTGVLEAIWSIRDTDGKILLPQRKSLYAVPTASPDHQGLAIALSGSLSLLCREVAREMSRQLQPAGE